MNIYVYMNMIISYDFLENCQHANVYILPCSEIPVEATSPSFRLIQPVTASQQGEVPVIAIFS